MHRTQRLRDKDEKLFNGKRFKCGSVLLVVVLGLHIEVLDKLAELLGYASRPTLAVGQEQTTIVASPLVLDRNDARKHFDSTRL